MSYRGGSNNRGGRGGSSYRGGHQGNGRAREQGESVLIPGEPCTLGLKCSNLYSKVGCRKEHSENDIQASKQLFIIQKFYQREAIAYLQADGTMKLYRFEVIPVHLDRDGEVDPEKYYQVSIGAIHTEGRGFAISIKSEFGRVGDLDIEQYIFEKYNEDRKYFKEWLGYFAAKEAQILNEPEGQVIVQQKTFEQLPDPSFKKGTYIKKFSGQEIVKCGSEKAQLIFEFKTNDQNRAIHGSEVIFKIKEKQPEVKPGANQSQMEKRFVEILDVKYPRNRTKIGYVKKERSGHLIFQPLDTKFNEMIIRDMVPELWQSIKVEQDSQSSFSYLKKSSISPEFIEKQFFKAELTFWSSNERNPYCRLIENLGPIFDEKNYRKIIALNQGISQEMYPKSAIDQAQKLAEEFEARIEEEKNVRKNYNEEDLVFTIDGPGAQALDDALSFKQLEPNRYRIGIHIADVASLILPGTPLDSEALKRASSTYVLRDMHMPMLPRELNSGICSLTQGNNRLAVTLSLDINANGVVDFDSLTYDLTALKSTVRLTYSEADSLVSSTDDSHYILSEKCDNQVETELRQKLQALSQVAIARKAFREIYDGVGDKDEVTASKVIIEEMMLLTSSALPYFKDRIINEAQGLYEKLVAFEKQRVSQIIKDKASQSKPQSQDSGIVEDQAMIDEQELNSEMIELSKKTSLQDAKEDDKLNEFVTVDVGPQDENDEDDAPNHQAQVAATEANLFQFQAAQNARNYLERFFKEIDVEFKCSSREEIEHTFEQGKSFKADSSIFAQFMDSQYAKNYQHFANMIIKAQEQAKSEEKIVEVVLEESKEKELMKNEENQKGSKIEKKNQKPVAEIIEQLEQLEIKEERKQDKESVESIPFDPKVNEQILRKIHQTSKEKQLKFSNPIRDYCHLMSNRLVILLINLHQKLNEASTFFLSKLYVPATTDLTSLVSSDSNTLLDHIKSLREFIDKVIKHEKKQLLYQNEIKFVRQNDSKMKTAEREITRLEYAFNILKAAGVLNQNIAAVPQEGEESKSSLINEDPLKAIPTIEGCRERVLLTRIFNPSKFEGWHPTLGEFDLTDGVKKDFRSRQQQAVQQPEEEKTLPQRYSEVDVTLKIKTFAPLTFESILKAEPKVSNEVEELKE